MFAETRKGSLCLCPCRRNKTRKKDKHQGNNLFHGCPHGLTPIEVNGCVSREFGPFASGGARLKRAGTALRRGEIMYGSHFTAVRLRRRRGITKTSLQFPSSQRHCESGFVSRSKWIVGEKSL